MNPTTNEATWQKFFNGDDWALGSILNLVENQGEYTSSVLAKIAAHTGKGYIVGITGPPGAGKSTMVNQLAKIFADNGYKVAVLAIDPTSPFTGGALLGDRVRMINLDPKSGVFIRSLATRGSLGGVSESTKDMVQVMDAAGKDVIIVETVGTGQVAFDIMDIADSTVVVSVPGLGDRMQTLKAGIMEIADIFVVNQADRPGADESVNDLKRTVDEFTKGDWKPPVLATEALNNKGIVELYEALIKHRDYLLETKRWEALREERSLKRFEQVTRELIWREVSGKLASSETLREVLEQVKAGLTDPYSGAARVKAAVMAAGAEE